MNNYFADGLKALEANIHIQPVFNHYKALDYIRVYLSKSEDESSEAMKETVEEANLDNYDQMKAIAHAYTNKRECSVQVCVCHILSGQ